MLQYKISPDRGGMSLEIVPFNNARSNYRDIQRENFPWTESARDLH